MNQKDTSCKTPRWFLLKAKLNNLAPEAFQSAIEQAGKDAYIIDVRTKEEFEAQHLPDAININYFDESLWEKLEALDKSKRFLIYCRTGRRSIRVCTLMRNGGFNNEHLYNMDGGMAAWNNLQSESGSPKSD